MKYFISILILFTLLNCQKIDKNIIPEKLLSEEELTQILIDVSQIKSIKSSSSYLDELKSAGIVPNEYLCFKYDIDSITLNENLAYYNYNPDELKKIYIKVLDSLDKSHKQMEVFINQRKKELEERRKERELCRKDSIQRVKRLDSIKKITEKTVKKAKKLKDTLSTH